MKKILMLGEIIVTLLIIFLSAPAIAADKFSRPNILLILTDDLGNNDLASWGDGSAPTPTLDALSRQSIRFRRHYTDSTCSPSRAALLTGREPVSIGFQANGLGLSADLDTLPKSLKALGYHTVHLGKWHIGEALEYPNIQPSFHGFDYWFGMLNHFVLRGLGPDGGILQRQPTHVNPWLQENGAAPKQYKGSLDDLLTSKAIELISKPTQQPWFINLWLFSPHTPYQPSAEFAARFPATPEGKFLAVLAQLDNNIARILQALDTSGQADNTIVVFASDNGGPSYARDNNWPLQGVKATYLEGGVRSPLLLRWPVHFLNADISAATTIMDIYPTLVELAGGKPPVTIDGQSLVRVMQGKPLKEQVYLFSAAENGNQDMVYGGRSLSDSRLFYRDTYGAVTSATLAPAIPTAPVSSVVVPFDKTQAQRLIKDWEARVRKLPLTWQPAKPSHSGILTGRDFQRAPVFAGYTLGLSLHGATLPESDITLVEQAGVWHVQLLADHRLRVVHGQVEQFSAPITEVNACNRLIVSMKINPEYSFPFPAPASAKLTAYWNDRQILDGSTLLQRPTSVEVLANPTFIGSRTDGSQAFPGEIGRPIVINKYLYPNQESYGLDDLRGQLCMSGKN
ncbi:MAG: sulfatase-like hydrolase/transferase [Pseudomonas sp.]|uniref:sulfatase-like hydrolase/transferase n=1 Tax=Pseudomonas sp. TaxID=306 RepID=UPI003BB6F1E0